VKTVASLATGSTFCAMADVPITTIDDVAINAKSLSTLSPSFSRTVRPARGISAGAEQQD
jgi:hypothetical protein